MIEIASIAYIQCQRKENIRGHKITFKQIKNDDKKPASFGTVLKSFTKVVDFFSLIGGEEGKIYEVI